MRETVWMTSLKYFQLKTTGKQPIPVPNGELSPSLGISYANTYVGKLLNSTPWSGDTHSRGPYANLSPAQKFEIGMKTAEIGTTHSNTILCHPL